MNTLELIIAVIAIIIATVFGGVAGAVVTATALVTAVLMYARGYEGLAVIGSVVSVSFTTVLMVL